MAKALIGYIGGPTPDQLRETARLRQRIADLESEVLRLKVENDGLLKTLSEAVEHSVEHVTASGVLETAVSA
jgi:regulator of replication initiation timing